MVYVFGPVPSRRLGLSLGVDLIPPKTCTYDCLYCQVGKTRQRIVEAGIYVPTGEVIKECENKLKGIEPDVITLAGSGEPTLHAQIDRVIASLKTMTDKNIALLTNGALLWDERIRHRVLEADIILPTFSSADERTWRLIHRPHPELSLGRIIKGFQSLRRVYKGLIFLEVVLLSGINDSEEEMTNLKKEIDRISPDRIQLNTVVRPPADTRAHALDRKRLEIIKSFMGEKAEIVAYQPLKRKGQGKAPRADSLLEMAKRRPVRVIDIVHALDLPEDDVQGLIKGMLIKGMLRSEEQSGEVYYLAAETDASANS